MRTFLSDFNERRRDVRRYLAVLIRSEQLIYLGKTPKKHERELRMVRAVAMLVLYNVIESSARSGIQAIYDEIEQSKTPFDELRVNIRKKVIKDFKSNFGIDRHEEIENLALNFVTMSFDPFKIFNGNVDAKELRVQSTEYGFFCDTKYVRTKNGSDLFIIKNKRNDLAHGVVSFSEVGREYTTKDIRQLGMHSLNYMEEILIQIDVYLSKCRYRHDQAALET